jgi:glycosyltransferase involved in cell wall biosynthesis
LVIAGGETLFDYRSYRAEFDARANELDIEPVVLGAVDHAELPALVAAAAVLPFLSTKEGFGLAAMEALAAGIPVVARDLPVLREVFADAVEFASTPDAMAAAMDRALTACPTRRARGQAIAREFTWDAAASAHLDFYDSVTGVHTVASQVVTGGRWG